ncbi:MAG: glutamate--tRNA ligase [Deltaproteobacteria bacterium]|nr:glutamate--tRNA ligase [Deltaproteobacteria bacterium]
MTSSSTPRTRFAPSPSGYLHIGGARTALFNFLYARRHGGVFILRVEDTDRERSTDASIAAILESLAWLDIAWDEGPFFQSQRTAVYVAEAERLLREGRAYPCFCTTEELEAKRARALSEGRKPVYDGTCRDRVATPGDAAHPHTVRFRGPKDGETPIDDLVKGRVVFQNAELDDLIILRSDRTPTYNFCVVVDDAEMRVTHVLRGDDHLANTPRQILLYRALGYGLPAFGHVPLILGPDKARLSKRHGAMAVTAYRDLGFLPEGVVNYLARLGWSHGDQEIFTRDELVAAFTVEAIGKSAGVFDVEKMRWVNWSHQKALTPDALVRAARPHLAAAGLPVPGDDAWLAKALATLQERAQTLVELVESGRYYFTDDVVIDPAAAAKFLTPAAAEPLRSVRNACAALGGWTMEALTAAFDDVLAKHGLKLGKVAQPVRVAVTGGTASPGIFEVLEILGRERTVARLDAALARIS